MKLSKILLLLLISLIFTFRLVQSTGCKEFKSLKFKPVLVKISVEEQVNIDANLNRNISRFFHNKVSATIWEFSKTYLQLLSPEILIVVIGPIGVFASLGLLTKINKRKFINISIILLLNLLAVTFLPKNISFYLLAAAWYLTIILEVYARKLSIFGNIIFYALVPVTFLYFSFSWELSQFCQTILFK